MVGRIQTAGPEKAGQNIKPCVFREAVVIQMTWPGAPTLYYGDEAGVCGWTDPDSRRTYPWGKEDLELIEFHRYMTGIHRKIPGCGKAPSGRIPEDCLRAYVRQISGRGGHIQQPGQPDHGHSGMAAGRY